MNYVLYKNPIQIETLEIVQYLHSLGCQNIIPICCIERNHPYWVTDLPSIETENGVRYIGLSKCIEYYETVYQVNNLYILARQFKKQNPDYRIHK